MSTDPPDLTDQLVAKGKRALRVPPDQRGLRAQLATKVQLEVLVPLEH